MRYTAEVYDAAGDALLWHFYDGQRLVLSGRSRNRLTFNLRVALLVVMHDLIPILPGGRGDRASS